MEQELKIIVDALASFGDTATLGFIWFLVVKYLSGKILALVIIPAVLFVVYRLGAALIFNFHFLNSVLQVFEMTTYDIVDQSEKSQFLKKLKKLKDLEEKL